MPITAALSPFFKRAAIAVMLTETSAHCSPSNIHPCFPGNTQRPTQSDCIKQKETWKRGIIFAL